MEGKGNNYDQVMPFAASETVCFERRGDEGNYFYIINGTASRMVSFKQLNGIYIKERSRGVYCCSLAMRSGDFQICRLIEEDFWGLVAGKIFKVVVDESTRKVLPSDQKTAKETVEILFNELDSGNEAILSEMTVSSPCYQMIEI